MKKKVNITKSLKKYIRLEKARIRRDVSDTGEQWQRIQDMYQKLGLPNKSTHDNK